MKHYHYNKREFEPLNKRWTGAMIGAAAIAATIGGGVAMYEGGKNREAAQSAQDQYNAQPDYIQLPEYPEADTARQDWGKTLTDWGQPGQGYGANLPDYNAIFENAKKRINQYYWGGATGGGVIDKIKAGAAQRGVQDSPAMGVLTSRMGAEEAGQIGDKSVEVDTQKAAAIESARNNWLNSLMQLSAQKPSFVSGKTGQFSAQSGVEGMTNLVGTIGQGAMQTYQSQQDRDFYSKLLSQSQASGGVTSLANPYGGGSYGGIAINTNTGFASSIQPGDYDFDMGQWA